MAKALVPLFQQALTEEFADAQIVIRAFGQGPPVSAPVGFRIFGPATDELRQLGEQLRALLHEEPGVTHTRSTLAAGEPKLWLAADEHRARLAGLTLGAVAEQFRTALDGRTGGRLLEDLEDLPVRIRYAAPSRESLDEVGTLKLRSPGRDGWIPAAALGELTLKPEPPSITRRNGERVNEISGYLQPEILPIEVTRSVLARLETGALDLPPGYRIEVAGDSAEQQQAVAQLLAYVPLLVTLMVASLVLTFRSFRLAGLIGLVALLSVGLGLLSLWVAGYPLGFNPVIGTAGLVGVAINGSIVVLAAIRGNPAARRGDPEAIVTETLGATRHILATTLTTVAGFVPLLAFSDGDFWPPLAVVIAGGVGLSGLLSLLFTPAAYRLLSMARPAVTRAPAAGRVSPRLQADRASPKAFR
jgi:multidrug efflux pump subunit AcrB